VKAIEPNPWAPFGAFWALAAGRPEGEFLERVMVPARRREGSPERRIEFFLV